MAISRSQLAKELEPGLNALFGLEYKRYENEAAEIFDQESSDRAFEEEVMLGGFAGAPVKNEGASINYDTAQESFTARYTNETIALAFAITEEAVEDNLYDRVSARYTKALARSMANTKQVKGANILNNAFSTNAANFGGDGVAFASTAHPTLTGGNFSNRSATDSDLNETSLEQAVIDVSNFIDERGLKIALKPMKMIIPAALQFVADRLMNSDGRVGTADNDINVTDTDAWFVKTDCPNGLKHFVRTPITTAMEGDFDTGNMRYKARERYSFGFSDPRAIYASQGS